jgi:hypothetical protein
MSRVPEEHVIPSGARTQGVCREKRGPRKKKQKKKTKTRKNKEKKT